MQKSVGGFSYIGEIHGLQHSSILETKSSSFWISLLAEGLHHQLLKEDKNII